MYEVMIEVWVGSKSPSVKYGIVLAEDTKSAERKTSKFFAESHSNVNTGRIRVSRVASSKEVRNFITFLIAD